MPDVAKFTMDVRTAEGRTAADMTGRVQFVKTDGTIVSAAPHVAFSAPRTFLLPPWPTVNSLRCDVTLPGFRAQTSRFFVPRADQPTEVKLTAMRDPGSWVPGFTAFDTLDPDRFARFLDVATASTAVDIKHGDVVGDRKSTRLNSSHSRASRMPSSA